MGAAKVALVCLLALGWESTIAFPEQGVYTDAVLNEVGHAYGFTKTMYANTQVQVDITCKHTDDVADVSVEIKLIYSPCINTDFICDKNCYSGRLDQGCPDVCRNNTVILANGVIEKETSFTYTCKETESPDASKVKAGNKQTESPDASKVKADNKQTESPDASKVKADNKQTESLDASKVKADNKQESQSKRAEANKTPETAKDLAVSDSGNNQIKEKQNTKEVAANAPLAVKTSTSPSPPNVLTTEKDGLYLVKVVVTSQLPSDYKVTMEAKSSYGYLSAADWPNYYFYMVLVIVYIIYQLLWLVMLACNWRDLLRVQYYIGAVILLGMVEKAALFAEYENINKHGTSISGAVIFAQLVSCLKRTLARVLIIIVSLGYGIVKPRLGPTLHKVLAVGVVYFIFAAIEGCIRVVREEFASRDDLIAVIPLIVIEVAICWWIFSSLVQTYRTLRLRRNVVKLSLYRHFTNALIFSVLASLAFAAWFIKMVRLSECVEDLRELWLEEGFWQILFTILLLVVIILWRPSANNQRYAFAPLLDAGEEEDEEDTIVMNEAFSGMKMRTQNGDVPKKGKDKDYKAEDDLKWIEEHIPASITDQVLNVDSDEERTTTRHEISKMD